MHKITEILSKKIAKNHQLIADFFTKKFAATPPLFYNSVDLRHSGIKIAPVDTNCFPAGFNNLSEDSKTEAKKITDEFLTKNFPSAKKILIIPENHTRNLRYWQNIKNLHEILSEKREVKIGTLIPEVENEVAFDLENGGSITAYAVKEGEDADLIVLNNDLTNGVPEILKNATAPIMPPLKMGWHLRTKSNHFTIYNQLAEELALILGIDPWLISSMHRSCDDVNFKEKKGIEELAKYVDELIENLRKKYAEYGIDEDPYCYIKADNGTYGIAVWPVFSGQEVLEINKKERNKMNMLKGSVQTQKVMIQEGIKTNDKISGKIAEPMIYLINGEVVGNLFRANETRDEKISLNAAGANFFDLRNLEEKELILGLEKNEINQVYSLIARLAALASSIENSQN
ncbi:MAG: glutamate--cysteine ligase [Proteobacteria bacterium]|nr:glutamate--cysteine ligase [Pseudomonadota bacterium]